MTTFNPSKQIKKVLGTTAFVAVASTMLFMAPVFDSALNINVFQGNVLAAEDDDRRAPPPTKSSQTLGRQVYQRIEEVMEFRDLEQYDEAREVLDEIRERYDRGQLNDREIYTMFLFYASLDQAEENYPGAIANYEEILKLEGLTQDQIEQTWYYIGSLYYALEDYPSTIGAFESYNEVALEPNDAVYLRIGIANYQIENYEEAIPPILYNMDLLRAQSEEIPQSTFSLLRALYFTLEDYPAAYQLLREMVVIFNDPQDWGYLAAIAGQLEKFTEQAHVYYVANAGGYLDSESQYINLASQLYNNDNPYGCSQVIRKGIDDGIIEEDEANLAFLATCYQVSREDLLASDPLARAAAMSEDGDLYARLGNIFLNIAEFEKAVDAFDAAFEVGDLNREDQVYLSQARAYRELNRYDEGIAAARAAGEADERSERSSDTWVQVLTNEKTRYDTLQQQRVELAEFFIR